MKNLSERWSETLELMLKENLELAKAGKFEKLYNTGSFTNVWKGMKEFEEMSSSLYHKQNVFAFIQEKIIISTLCACACAAVIGITVKLMIRLF